MQIENQAVIIDQQKFQESKYIVTLLTKDYGLCKGLFAANKKNKADMLCGNVVNMHWNARLTEHLGFLKLETTQNIFTIISNDQSKLAVVNSALAMCKVFLQEKEPQIDVFEKLVELLTVVKNNSNPYKYYVLFELLLLQKSGYGLDLSKCIATNETENLAYISPRSGCAVSKEAGEPYKDKMFILPQFFLDSSVTPVVDDIKNGIKVLNHFLEKLYFDPYGKKIPLSRVQLANAILCS